MENLLLENNVVNNLELEKQNEVTLESQKSFLKQVLEKL